jgi:hypothetical protein
MIRPVSTTVVAWLIIAYALEGISGALSSLGQGFIAQVINGSAAINRILYIGISMQVVLIVLAIYILRGANWARIAYACSATLIALSVIAQTLANVALLPTTIFTTLRTGVLIVFLFQAQANAYFAAAKRPSDA